MAVPRRIRWWGLAVVPIAALHFAGGMSSEAPSLAVASDVERSLPDGEALGAEVSRSPQTAYGLEEVKVKTSIDEQASRGGPAPRTFSPSDPPVDKQLSASTPSSSAEEISENEFAFGDILPGHQEVDSILYGELAASSRPALSSRFRRLSVNDAVHLVVKRIQVLIWRIKAGARPFLFPHHEEEPGQNILAQLMAKLKLRHWLKQSLKRMREFVGTTFLGQTDETIIVSNGTERKEVELIRELGRTEDYIDTIVKEGEFEWIGRLYVENPEQQSAAAALEKDFAILTIAPVDESIQSFRHRTRLDLPIELYAFEGAGSYLMAPDGQIFLNALARRPLVRVTAAQLVNVFVTKLRNTKKGRKALLTLSQQAVRVASTLSCMMIVHTNINPSAFLITEKGLVFLGGLHQAVASGEKLPQPLKIAPGFTPPELNQQETPKASFAIDAWQLGVTLYTFWCGTMPADDSSTFSVPGASSGAISFSSCSAHMPKEMQNLITALTQSNPDKRLLLEPAALLHPAMLLPIIPGGPPQMDTDQDDAEDID